ncbi:MAG TPA: indole-3-glycerol phosphate synthase TrpC [Candidatus Micrarchaeia archaeon]|nr:indole-3-glycerol phosphate synthase TrpC [Candidatus Micrarchaeia archaeon]
MSGPTGGALGPLLDGARRRLEAARLARPSAVLWDHARARAATDPPRPFAARLGEPGLTVIAEIKRRSPSGGSLRPDLDPAALGRAYAAGGAGALSVLTEPEQFGGRLEDLGAAREASGLACLRKDFVVDPYQVAEARAAGADAVLLIVAAVALPVLVACLRAAGELGMGAVVEVHTEREVETALGAGAGCLGINNRDLDRLTTDLAVTERLRPLVPAGVVVVAESGIRDAADLGRMEAAGADAVLIGEGLLRAADPGDACRVLVAAALRASGTAGRR